MKFKMTKRLLFLVFACIICFGFLCNGCSGSKTPKPNPGPEGDGYDPTYNTAIKANVNYSLFEYDIKTHEEIVGTSNSLIEVGKYYKLAFQCEFDASTLEFLKDGSITISITVSMGDYENEENTKHLLHSEEFEDGSGPQFNPDAEMTGVWHADYKLTRTYNDPNLQYSYFILHIDSLGNGSNLDTYQAVSISFDTKDDSREVNVNGSNVFRTTLIPTKGYYTWDGSKDIYQLVGVQYKANTYEIKLPKSCGEVEIVFWSDETKTKKFGIYTINENNEQFAEQFVKGKLELTFSDYLKNFIGMDKWNEVIFDQGFYEVYLEVIVKGGLNYNDSMYGLKLQLI